MKKAGMVQIMLLLLSGILFSCHQPEPCCAPEPTPIKLPADYMEASINVNTDTISGIPTMTKSDSDASGFGYYALNLTINGNPDIQEITIYFTYGPGIKPLDSGYYE